MTAYIIRRVLLIIPTIILVTLIVFVTIRLIPGSVIDLMVAEHGREIAEGNPVEMREEISKAIRHYIGLDLPLHVQYGRWISGIIMHGDLGKSLWRQTPVTEDLLGRFPVSFELGLLAITAGLLIAVPVGIYSAIRQDTAGDYMSRSFAILCITLPTFWVGTIVMVYPSIWWGWTPPMKYIPFQTDPIGNLVQFAIPAIILGMALSGSTMRMTRTMMLEVLRQDYIRTAWSKGLAERQVIMKHALRNAFIPVITIIGSQMPLLIGGSIILEQIFNLPGIGRLTVEVISRRDYPVLSGINLVMATFVLIINLAVDLTYGYLDPRVHYR